MDPSTEADAEDMRRRLRRAERLLACFQKALGHELPNQLVAIQGLVYVVRDEAADQLGGEGRDSLDRLGAVVGRTHALVRELAEVGRTVRQNAAGGEAVLHEVAEEVVAEARQRSPGQVLVWDLADAGKPLPLPELGLREVLACLVGHALRRAAGQPVRLEIGARATTTGTEVWVTDDGRALTAAEGQQLFEPFVGDPQDGPRLRMFLCSLLVDGWGGSIEVATPPGGGNRFTILVPGAS
jgi:signal transduction histidine kinase